MKKTFIYWSENYSVGIKEIDEQHKKLVEMINDLYDAFMNKEHKEKVEEIVTRMAEYTVVHFNFEEEHFKKFGYIGSQVHIAEHKSFLDHVNLFSRDLTQNKATLTFKIITFLQKWLLDHIMVSDKKYVKCFKDSGFTL